MWPSFGLKAVLAVAGGSVAGLLAIAAIVASLRSSQNPDATAAADNPAVVHQRAAKQIATGSVPGATPLDRDDDEEDEWPYRYVRPIGLAEIIETDGADRGG